MFHTNKLSSDMTLQTHSLTHRHVPLVHLVRVVVLAVVVSLIGWHTRVRGLSRLSLGRRQGADVLQPQWIARHAH